jgi:class 3 adenylate cyclase/CHASE2 domain-containing sensor protein
MTALRRIPYRVRKALLLAAVGCAVGALGFGGQGWLELFFVDARFVLSAAFSARPESTRIAIIRMDARSAASLGVPQGILWRRFHPAVVDTLRKAGASLIVVDALFVDSVPELDPALARAFHGAGNVIAGEEPPGGTTAALRPSLAGTADLRIRLVGGEPRFVPWHEGAAPLSVVAARAYRARQGLTGGWEPSAPGFWIDYREPAGRFPSFSYADVYGAADGRLADPQRTPVSFFKDRIVLIGLDDPSGTNDRFPLPSTLGAAYPGAWGHAFATEMILDGRPLTRTPPLVDAAACLAFLLLLCLCIEAPGRGLRTTLVILLPAAAFACAQALLSAAGVWLGYAPLFAGFWVVLILHWSIVRVVLARRLRSAVGFDPALLDRFHSQSLRAGGALRRDAVILVADVRGYTSFVSATDPATVTAVMTEYLDAMERCITEEGGWVNKYVGDEIVAVFGFPLASEAAAERAVRAAQSMLRRLAALVDSWTGRGMACIRAIGIGVDAGPAVFTEVGGRSKIQFDIIGDCINGAARIQALTKELRHGLAISEEAWRLIQDIDELAAGFERVGSLPIRGQGNRTLYGFIG